MENIQIIMADMFFHARLQSEPMVLRIKEQTDSFVFIQ